MHLITIGVGEHGQVVADVAEQTRKYSSIIFLDDAASCTADSCSDYAKYIDDEIEFYGIFGNNICRVEWLNKMDSAGAKLAVIVHSTAYVSPRANFANNHFWGCILCC